MKIFVSDNTEIGKWAAETQQKLIRKLLPLCGNTAAPLVQIFDQTEVHFDAPPDAFKRYKTRICSRCGEDCREPYLRVVDGEIVCLDCAEKG